MHTGTPHMRLFLDPRTFAFGDSPYGDQFLTCQRSSLESRVNQNFHMQRAMNQNFACTTSCTRHVQNRSHDMKSPYAYGDQDQSPSAYGDQVIRGSSESPYAYGDCMSCDPRMHIGIKIDPRMHTEIAEFPVCIWGSHDT
jgi:hypothetical protein